MISAGRGTPRPGQGLGLVQDRLVFLSLMALLLLFLRPFITLYATYPEPSWGSLSVDRSMNGLWLDETFLDGFSETGRRDSILAESGSGFRSFYVDLGAVRPDGTLPAFRLAKAKTIMNKLETSFPGPRKLAVLSVPNRETGGWVELADPEVRRNVVKQGGQLVTEAGFDGILLHVRSWPSGDEKAILLLQLLDRELGDQAPLVVFGQKWRPNIWPINISLPVVDDSYWDSDYYARVASLAEEIVLPAFGSAALTPAAYRNWIAHQVKAVAGILKTQGVGLVVAVPAFREKAWNHLPSAESLEHAISGIKKLKLSDLEQQTLLGLAPYRATDMGKAEADVWSLLWQSSAR